MMIGLDGLHTFALHNFVRSILKQKIIFRLCVTSLCKEGGKEGAEGGEEVCLHLHLALVLGEEGA